MAKINDKCIACGTCANITPTAKDIFEFDNDFKMTVKKQPETAQEIADYELAKVSCPVEAIED